MTRVARAALDESRNAVSQTMDQEQMATDGVSPGAVQAPW